jgi:hypothetical protein
MGCDFVPPSAPAPAPQSAQGTDRKPPDHHCAADQKGQGNGSLGMVKLTDHEDHNREDEAEQGTCEWSGHKFMQFLGSSQLRFVLVYTEA